MSSSESSSISSPQPAAPAGKPRSSVGVVVLSLILMAGLVWYMAPARGKFEPAPLRPPSVGCAQTVPEFVPSDLTEIPGVDLSSLSKAQRNHVLYRLNMEPCPCGCNISIAACRVRRPSCKYSKELVDKIVAEESAERSQEPEARSRK